MVSLEASRKIVLTITDSGEAKEAPAAGRRIPLREGREKALRRLNSVAVIPKNPKAKGKSTSSYKIRSYIEISLLKRGTKK